MDKTQKTIMAGVNLFTIALLVSAVVFATGIFFGNENNSLVEITEDQDILSYDGKVLKGSEVKDIIYKLYNEEVIVIEIKNDLNSSNYLEFGSIKGDSLEYNYKKEDLESVNDIYNSSSYVQADENYICESINNEDNIIGIRFTKIK